MDGVGRFVASDEQIGREMEKEKRGERWQRSTNMGGGRGGAVRRCFKTLNINTRGG